MEISSETHTDEQTQNKGFILHLQKAAKKWRNYFRMSSRFSPVVRKQKNRLVLSVLFALGYTLTGLLEPWPIKMIFDTVLLDKYPLPPFLAHALDPFLGHPFTLLNIFVISIIAIAVVRGLMYYFQQILLAKSGQLIVSDLRVQLYSHVQRLCFSFHDRRRTGDILMRLTSDIRILRDILVSLPLLVLSEFFLVIGMVIVMFLMNWRLALMALCIVPILILLLRVYQKPMKQAARRQREREGRLATVASEVLGAIKVVHGFQREQYEIDRFGVHNKDSLRSGLKATRLEAKMRWATGLAIAFVTAIVIGFAVRQVLNGILSPGDVLVFSAYLHTFNRPLRRISSITERLARGTTAGERVTEMLRKESKVIDLPHAVEAKGLIGEIQFENVGFFYQTGEHPVLQGIQLNIKRGEKIVVVGPTGSGKSTLLSLLPRFYDPTEGVVRIDGQDIKEFTLFSLRQQISLVFQEPVLFASTIAENIAYGKPHAEPEEIVEAAKMAGIHNIIISLPDGYNTLLGERGGTLSGGQRQCVAIARALIKNAPIVILDEPTAGLDAQSAALVMNALHRLVEGRTVIIVTHQPSIMQEAHRLIALEGGRIVEEATPAQFLAKRGLLLPLNKAPVVETIS